MYIRKYAPSDEKQATDHLSIPENYAGNAFTQTATAEAIYQEEPACEVKGETPRECADASDESPRPQSSSELLPVLLSVLLSEEHEDIASVLLFLLLL